MLLIRVGVLFLVFAATCGVVPKKGCQIQCSDNNPPSKLCAFNGRCKFEFNSRCDLNFYNCRYGFQFINVWGDFCEDPRYGTCNSFYEPSKHSYFPIPLSQG